MKVMLSAVLAMAMATTPATAQELPVRLKDGASWTITAEHTRQTEGLNSVPSWSLTTVKRLTWHAGGKRKPDTLTVSPLSAVPGAGSPAELAAARSLAIPATLAVSESLAPGEVLNRDEVRAEFLRLVPKASGASTDIIDASSKAMIASELATASRGQGFSLKLNQPVSGTGSLASPLGGPPLRATETVELAAVNDKATRAVIRWRQVADPDSFKASNIALLETMARNKVDPAQLRDARAAFATTSMTNETSCLYEIDIRTGLARRGDCQMDIVVAMGGKTQKVTEHWTISQTPPDPS